MVQQVEVKEETSDWNGDTISSRMFGPRWQEGHFLFKTSSGTTPLFSSSSPGYPLTSGTVSRDIPADEPITPIDQLINT
ncbi:Teneurin-2 [Liparis tanakae]|uniref:Teneurin-2 n=1 Tax=Liparis tanakae TaxID=230148 RepID=A0A4Z2FA04_9TELE|nr:Teneurin-2 [Liparis tanakae]